MSLSINTNVISLAVQRNFNASTNKMNNAMEKMTTGFKINTAADDAAGYGVVKNLESILNTYTVAETNGEMGSSLLQTQEGVLEIISSYVQRIRDLTEQAANGTYATSSRIAIASEVKQRMNEMNRMCDVTDFNGLKLLDGSQVNGVNLQVGIKSGEENVIVLDKTLFEDAHVTSIMDFATLGGVSTASNATQDDTHKYKGDTNYFESAMLAAINAYDKTIVADDGTIDVTKMTIENICDAVFSNDNSAREFLDIVDIAVSNLTTRATEIGSYMNRVDSAVESLAVQSDNLTEAKSLIKDADIAQISSEYLSYQILQQAGATMLTTANQATSIALNLI